MEAYLAEAAQPVLRDLAATSAVHLRVDPPTFPSAGQQAFLLTNIFGHAMQVQVPVGILLPERIVTVADQVQEWTVESLCEQGLPATWPECPTHPNSHPLRPAVRSGRAVWECPRSSSFVSDIGGMAATDR